MPSISHFDESRTPRKAEANMSSSDDFRRKAKWHDRREQSIGNRNVADSYRQTAMLKDKLALSSAPQDFAFRK